MTHLYCLTQLLSSSTLFCTRWAAIAISLTEVTLLSIMLNGQILQSFVKTAIGSTGMLSLAGRAGQWPASLGNAVLSQTTVAAHLFLDQQYFLWKRFLFNLRHTEQEHNPERLSCENSKRSQWCQHLFDKCTRYPVVKLVPKKGSTLRPNFRPDLINTLVHAQLQTWISMALQACLVIKKWALLQLGPPSRSWNRPLTSGLRKKRSILKGNLFFFSPCSQTQEQLHLIPWYVGHWLARGWDQAVMEKNVSLRLREGSKCKVLALATPHAKARC